MGTVGVLIKSAVGANVLDPLAEELNISHISGRRILAALTYKVLRDCDCGLTPENEVEVKKRLCYSIMPYIEFEVYVIAANDSMSLGKLLCDNVPSLREFDLYKIYEEYIYPFLRDNEIIPGVKMRG